MVLAMRGLLSEGVLTADDMAPLENIMDEDSSLRPAVPAEKEENS